MEQDNLAELVDLYEGGYADIIAILEDDDLTQQEQLDAIEEVVYGNEDTRDPDSEEE